MNLTFSKRLKNRGIKICFFRLKRRTCDAPLVIFWERWLANEVDRFWPCLPLARELDAKHDRPIISNITLITYSRVSNNRTYIFTNFSSKWVIPFTCWVFKLILKVLNWFINIKLSFFASLKDAVRLLDTLK